MRTKAKLQGEDTHTGGIGIFPSSTLLVVGHLLALLVRFKVAVVCFGDLSPTSDLSADYCIKNKQEDDA